MAFLLVLLDCSFFKRCSQKSIQNHRGNQGRQGTLLHLRSCEKVSMKCVPVVQNRSFFRNIIPVFPYGGLHCRMTSLQVKMFWRRVPILWYIQSFQSLNHSNFLHSLTAKRKGSVLCGETLVTRVLLSGLTYQESACEQEHRTCGVTSSKKSQENGNISSGFLVVLLLFCL